MVYSYWLGGFFVIFPVMLGLPLLSRNRVYRTATLFAGMTAGIITFSFFIELVRWDHLLRQSTGSAYADQLHAYFTQSLPSLYIASLIIGSTIVSKYYLNSSTRAGALLATLGCLLGVYVLSIVTADLLEILSITINKGFPSFDVLLEIAHRFLIVLIHPNLYAVFLIFAPAFFALNGTAAAMRIPDETEPSEDQETE